MNADVAMAARLAGFGIGIVPCCRPTTVGACTATWHDRPCTRAGKRPLVPGYAAYAETPLPPKDAAALVSRHAPANIAVVTGRGLVVIEADSPEAEAEVVTLACGEVGTPTRERRPGRGRAWLFRTQSDVACGAHLGRSGAIDVRGRGGILVVHGVHLSGHIIGWVPGMAPWDVPLATLPPGLGRLVKPARPHAVLDIPSAPAPLVMPGRVAMLVRVDRRLAALWAGTGRRSGDLSRSGYDLAVAHALLRRRLSPTDVVAAVTARPDGHHPGDAAYAKRTVVAALAARRTWR